jgi:CHAD domain-containing protein
MMRLWARHWLDFCRGMPLRGRRLLDGIERDPARRVHDFRRLMKAWRSLLKLAPRSLAEEAAALRAEIKQLRRSFGATRDAVVVARTLQELSPKAGGKLASPPDQAPAPETVAAMRDALDRLSVRMEAWSVAGERGGFLLAAFRRSYRKARRAARHDPRRMSLKRLHAWRTRVIDLGYQLSFFQPAAPFYYKEQIEAVERLRTHLGAVVDLDMADRRLAIAAEAEPLTKLRKKLGRRVARQRGKAAAMIGRVLGERPRTACAHLAAAMTHQEPRRIRLV